MTVRFGTQVYGTIRSNFEANGTVRSVRYVGTVRLILQGTGTDYALFNSKNSGTVF